MIEGVELSEGYGSGNGKENWNFKRSVGCDIAHECDQLTFTCHSRQQGICRRD